MTVCRSTCTSCSLTTTNPAAQCQGRSRDRNRLPMWCPMEGPRRSARPPRALPRLWENFSGGRGTAKRPAAAGPWHAGTPSAAWAGRGRRMVCGGQPSAGISSDMPAASRWPAARWPNAACLCSTAVGRLYLTSCRLAIIVGRFRWRVGRRSAAGGRLAASGG
jgi:hypothetical protein